MWEILKNYMCSFCNRVFTSPLKLQQHRRVYRFSHFSFPCCNKHFEWSQMKVVINHICFNNETCATNITSSVLNNEQKSESDSTAFQCDNCPTTFTRFSSLKNHIIKYPSKHFFPCCNCQKHFKSERALERHLCFLKSGSFKCACAIEFKELKTFRDHVGSRRPFLCCVCKKRNATFSNLINHIRTHTRERPFQCSTCGKAFKVRESMMSHRKIHGRKHYFHCSKCSYSSVTKWNLLLHEKRHVVDRDKERSFYCALCGSGFFLKHHLKRHMSVHSEKSHLCRMCGKLFSQGSYLEKHLEKHERQSETGRRCATCAVEFARDQLYDHHAETGHFPFVCNPCRKVFLTKFNLERHCKKHDVITNH